MSERERYLVGCTKIPHAERDVARDVLGDSGDERAFFDIIGADTHDDDEQFPVGSRCTYAVNLTEHEAERFADASNCRYVERDQVVQPLYTMIDDAEPQADAQPMAVTGSAAASQIPLPSTQAWMRSVFNGSGAYHGRDVPICILDQGTTAAVRSTMGFTLLGRKVFAETPPAGEVHPNDQGHGCLVAPNGVPYGGRFFDGLISEPDGGATYAAIAAGLRWGADVGAKLINLSFGGSQTVTAMQDAIEYIEPFGVQFYAAAGNNSQPFASYPAAYQAFYPHVHAIIAFNDATDTPASFTNYAGSLNGCAPGVQVTSLSKAGELLKWSGTSAATPHAVSMVARLMTGGRITATQAASIMEANLRDTGQNPYQGMGAFQVLAPLQASIAQYGLGKSSGALLSIA